MKPLISESQDTETLKELGRASVQIVHDLKNQLNGLKLYATFLRKRMEKTERPADEQETIAKLISGLERAATDMTVLVRYGRPVELRRQPQADLCKILADISHDEPSKGEMAGGEINLKLESGQFEGAYDVTALTEAFKAITAGARNLRRTEDEPEALEIHLRREENEDGQVAVIEWRGVKFKSASDPFHSFAGSEALRMSLAAKIIAAHGGEAAQAQDVLRVRLPVSDHRP